MTRVECYLSDLKKVIEKSGIIEIKDFHAFYTLMGNRYTDRVPKSIETKFDIKYYYQISTILTFPWKKSAFESIYVMVKKSGVLDKYHDKYLIDSILKQCDNSEACKYAFKHPNHMSRSEHNSVDKLIRILNSVQDGGYIQEAPEDENSEGFFDKIDNEYVAKALLNNGVRVEGITAYWELSYVSEQYICTNCAKGIRQYVDQPYCSECTARMLGVR